MFSFQMLNTKQIALWSIGRATKEVKYQIVFNIGYLFDKGFPHQGSDKENKNMLAYLEYLQTKQNLTDVQIQDDKNVTEVLLTITITVINRC